MSDVIRNAVIKLAIQLQSPELKVPGVDAAIKQQQDLAKATAEAAAVTERASQVINRASASTTESAQSLAADSVAAVKAKTATEELEKAKQKYADTVNAIRQAEADGVTMMPALEEAHAKAADELTAAYERQEIAEVNLRKENERQEESAKRAAARASAQADREEKEKQRQVNAQARADAAYAKAGNSLIRLAHGMALVAAGSSDSLQSLLPMIVQIEGAAKTAHAAAGAYTLLSKAMKLQAAASGAAATSTTIVAAAGRSLLAVLNPVTIAAGLAYVIWNRLNAIYRHFVPTQDEVNKRLREEFEARERANQALEEADQRYQIILDAQLEHIDLLANETQKQQALLAFMSDPANTPDKSLQAGRQLLQTLDKQKQSLAEQKREAIELVKTRERDLKTAKEALKAEQDRDQSLRASIGALNAGEKKRLEKLTAKVEGGGQLSQKEAIDLQKLGGDAGQKLGEKFLAVMDGGLGARLEKLVGDPLKKAQDEYERRQQSFNKTTGGKSADAAIASINEFDAAMSKSIDTVKESITAKLSELIDAVRNQKLDQSRQQSARRAERAALDGK